MAVTLKMVKSQQLNLLNVIPSTVPVAPRKNDFGELKVNWWSTTLALWNAFVVSS